MKLTPSLDKFQVALRRELAYHPSVVRHQCLMPTPEEVRSWWIRWPRAAIGIVPGVVSWTLTPRMAVICRENPSLQGHVALAGKLSGREILRSEEEVNHGDGEEE